MWLTNGDNEANKKLLLRWISLRLLFIPFVAAVIFLLGYRSQRGGADLEVLVAGGGERGEKENALSVSLSLLLSVCIP